MFINPAFATEAAATTADVSPMNAVVSQFILITVLVLLFYVLLILPQKKRFKEHKAMLDGLNKGDKIVTAGGLVGKIDTINADDDEILIDLGNGTKVTALRSTIHKKVDREAANDKGDKEKK